MIYFMLAEEMASLKIGYAENPQSRLSKLRTDCPCEVRLLAVMEGDTAQEKALHERFHVYRRRGEWFSYTSDLRAFVEALTPVIEKRRAKSRIEQMSEAAGISKSYMWAIYNGKQRGPIPLLLHILKTTGWKHPTLANTDNEALFALADAVPWVRKGSNQTQAA